MSAHRPEAHLVAPAGASVPIVAAVLDCLAQHGRPAEEDANCLTGMLGRNMCQDLGPVGPPELSNHLRRDKRVSPRLAPDVVYPSPRQATGCLQVDVSSHH